MFRAVLSALCLAFALAGCGGGDPKFQLTDVTGADIGREFALTDHQGQPRTLQDFRGKVTVIFFGFTHCPDVCPTTLSDFAQVMKALPPADAARLQVLFVTVDPERDTREVLAQYVPSFHPSFLGLYGDAEATARTAKTFKIHYRKQPQPGGSYTVDHSAGTYIYDAEGRLRLFAQYGAGPQTLLHDIRQLLGS